jgi:hypothetical protein
VTTAATRAPVAADGRPGLAPHRLVRLMRACVEEMRIDLTGAVVLTEAATGPYAVTPVLAALAGATEVVAVTRPSRHGTVETVRDQTFRLADLAGVGDRLLVTEEPALAFAGRADVVTNSGHVRPLSGELVAGLKPTAVVPLMFEAWEIQAGRFDIDLDALAARGIAVAGTNERHPAVRVFEHLGTMAVKLMVDAGTAVHGSRVVVLCDNPFAPYLRHGLTGLGARVLVTDNLITVPVSFRPDVVLVSLRPRGRAVLDEVAMATLVARWPDVVVAQFWGDLDRAGMDRLGLRCWPDVAPVPGHMGVLPSDVGPEPVVRLQAGGLKVAAVLRTPPADRSRFDLEFLDEL